VAVSPDFTKGAVYQGWRGDGIDTTAGDIFLKFREMKGGKALTSQFYDWQSKDFYTIASRVGEPFVPAEKSHEIGEQTLNVLFKNLMLDIFKTTELRKLDGELTSLRRDTAKRVAKDDFADALRYAVTKIPWNFQCLDDTPKSPRDPRLVALETMSDRERHARGLSARDFQESLDTYASEFAEANSLSGHDDDYDW
jgi:hypothetical protein